MLVVVGVDGFPGTEATFQRLLPPVVLVMLAGPSVAGLLATSVFRGRSGLRDLAQSMMKWRVARGWYAIALLVAPLVVFSVLSALSIGSGVFRPGVLTVEDPVSHVAIGMATGLAAGFFEEIGWTGFALPRLRHRHGVVTAGLIVGVAWGAWHLLVTWWGSAASSGGVSMWLYLPAMTLSFLPPYRILMAWVHDRTGSLLVAMLMHGSLTASVRILDPVPISGMAIVTYNLALGSVLWMVVILLVGRNRQAAAVDRGHFW